MAAPMDFNVIWTPDKHILKQTIGTLLSLGYEGVAINYFVEELKTKTSKKGKEQPLVLKKPQEILPSEDELQQIAKENKISRKPFRVVSRFSTCLSDPNQVHRIQKDEVIRKYDLLSVRPTNEKCFLLACKSMDIDIISINMAEKFNFKFKRTNVGVALERGIHFEVEYSPMIRDSTSRRNILSNMMALVRVCRGKNIIISSGTLQALELRGPYDVANLCLLFNMKENQGKAAVSSNCDQVLVHAKGRKTMHCTVSMRKLTEEEAKTLEAVSKETSEDTEKTNSQAKRKNENTADTAHKKIKTEINSVADNSLEVNGT